MTAAKFWLVWREGGGCPTFSHDNLLAARMEANRLAGKHPGDRFIVLEAIEARTLPTSIVVEKLECAKPIIPSWDSFMGSKE